MVPQKVQTSERASETARESRNELQRTLPLYTNAFEVFVYKGNVLFRSFLLSGTYRPTKQSNRSFPYSLLLLNVCLTETGAKNQPPAKKIFTGGSSFASQQGSFLYTRARVCCVHAPFGRAASGAAARHSHSARACTDSFRYETLFSPRLSQGRGGEGRLNLNCARSGHHD